MGTFAQISASTALNPCVGPDAQTALAQTYAPDWVAKQQSLNGPWCRVPDGTKHGAAVTVDGNGNVTGSKNPVDASPIASPDTVQKTLTQSDMAALAAALPVLQKIVG